MKHLLKSLLITYKKFIKNFGYHGNINKNSIVCSRLPLTKKEQEENDNPKNYVYRLNLTHNDIFDSLKWANNKIERLNQKQK